MLHQTKTSSQGNRQCTEHYLQYAHMISHLTAMVEDGDSDSDVNVAPTSDGSEITTDNNVYMHTHTHHTCVHTSWDIVF